VKRPTIDAEMPRKAEPIPGIREGADAIRTKRGIASNAL
jgi:hypothetical protein